MPYATSCFFHKYINSVMKKILLVVVVVTVKISLSVFGVYADCLFCLTQLLTAETHHSYSTSLLSLCLLIRQGKTQTP